MKYIPILSEHNFYFSLHPKGYPLVNGKPLDYIQWAAAQLPSVLPQVACQYPDNRNSTHESALIPKELGRDYFACYSDRSSRILSYVL